MVSNLMSKSVQSFKLKRSDYFTGKNYFTERKRALQYIHPHTLYVEFTFSLGYTEVGLGFGLGNRFN